MEMLPYSELDNYKLQVELLQEKLQRSEENRKKLENKLEHAKQKKSEQEKIVRAKQREKFQDFLAELEKRNERNRQLMKMLERVDQQTAALSSRSERLRMMKMQYEMYFAKLVQTQTMRCIQATTPQQNAAATFLSTTPTPIPVLLPTGPLTQQQQPTIMTPAPIKNNEHEPLTPAQMTTAPTVNSTQQPTTTAIYQCDASGNLIAAGTASTPVTYTTSPRNLIANTSTCNTIPAQPTHTIPTLAASTQHWTLAMATPTPAGMLLTSTPTVSNTSTAAAAAAVATLNLGATDYIATVPTYDYMQYSPLGYLPRMRHLLQQKPNMSIYSDESDDLLPPMGANTKCDRYRRSYMDNDNNNTNNTTNNDDDKKQVREIEGLNRMDLPTRQLDNDKISEVSTTTATPIIQRIDNERQNTQQQQLLSAMSPTFSATSLTLDKLPKTMTMTEHDTNTTFASSSIDDSNNDVKSIENDGRPKVATRFDEFSKGMSIIDEADKGALPIQRNEKEKSQVNIISSNAAAPTSVISNDNGNFIEENLRQKINTESAWQQQQQHHQQQQQQPHMTQSWHQTENSTPSKSRETTSGDKDNTMKFTEMTGGFAAEYAENKVKNNGSKSNDDNNDDNDGGGGGTETTTKKVSIEKIENEIYGELVNPPPISITNNVVDARNAAKGLVSELVTQQHQQQQPQQENQESTYQTNSIADDSNSTTAAVYDQSISGESYDPAYATVEGTTNAEVYSTPIDNNAYTTDASAAEYAQYANTDPNAQYAMDPNAQYTTDPNAMQTQQDYDYTNYDATQYATDGTYDPNIYPGYTYDETTGQYTPNEQYNAADGANTYSGQEAYDQQQYDASQQNVTYDYGNYEQQTADTTFPDSNNSDPQQQQQQQLQQNEGQIEPTNIEAIESNTASTSKPTSILSSGDKHATNEAQKKKKRVNFVDSSETDESSSVKQAAPSGSNISGAANESDFDFSTSDKSGSSVSGGA